MTNEQIIFNNRVDLMDKGIIKGTGNKITVENEEGKKIELEEPEQIHTYAGWKALNRQVKKGEKSIASFMIWKYTTKKPKEKDEEPQEAMFQTKAVRGKMNLPSHGKEFFSSRGKQFFTYSAYHHSCMW